MASLIQWTCVLSKLRKGMKDREAWCAAVCGSQRVRYDLMTKQQQQHQHALREEHVSCAKTEDSPLCGWTDPGETQMRMWVSDGGRDGLFQRKGFGQVEWDRWWSSRPLKDI